MKTLSLYIIVSLLFLGFCHELWSEGMFMDGLYYATIANNLANNIGSFWFLHFTNTEFPIFHEHPPLAFGIQSLLFSLFGDSIYVERIYSLLTYIITGLLIHYIWKEVMGDENTKYSWIPLFLWIIMPLNARGCSNNLLENTMNIFVSSSVLFAIKHIRTQDIRFLFLSGLALLLAFLSKGFTGMFPLIIFILYSLIFHRNNLSKSISKTLLLIISTLTPLLIIYLFNPNSISSLSTYIQNQVINSISSVSTVNSRSYILYHLGLQLDFIKLFTISAILINLIINILRKFNLFDKIKKHDIIFLSFLLLTILYPFNELNISEISFTKYPLINLATHLSIINISFYFIYKFLRISSIEKNLPFYCFIISIIITTKIWGANNILGHFVYLFSEFQYLILLLSIIVITISFFIFKNIQLFSEIKKSRWFVLIIIILLSFDWYNSYFNLIKNLSKPIFFYSILALYFLFTILKNKSSEIAKHTKWSLLFLLLGTSGVLPIMISLKQGSFYIITTLPFFSISFAIIIFPLLRNIVSIIDKKIIVLFALITLIFLGPFASISIKFKTPHTIVFNPNKNSCWYDSKKTRTVNSLKYQYKRTERDKDILDDIRLLLEIIPKNITINIDFQRQWEIHGYFARFSNISLDKNMNNEHAFLLSFEEGWIYDDRKGKYAKIITENKSSKKEFIQISKNTNKLHLYKRR